MKDYGSVGNARRRLIAPSLRVTAVKLLLAGRPIVEVWTRFERQVAYDTLCVWKRRGKTAERYIIAEWFICNRDRVERLRERGLYWSEIIRKTKYPKSNATSHGFWRTFVLLAHLEDEYQMR